MRRRVVLTLLLLASALALASFACSGVPSTAGLGEPVVMRAATFKKGALPASGPAPTITAINTSSTVIQSGQTAKALSGRTSPDAVAVAIRFADLGSGYWVFPVGGVDPQNNGELEWQISADFAVDLPTGKHGLDVVAIDGAGAAGPVNELPLCVASALPDNGNACDDTKLPPAALFSLTWDTAADVDLVVITPDGRQVDAKHPRSVAPPPPGPSTGEDAGTTTSLGVIDRDSNAGCVIDNEQRENMVFQSKPSSGSYLIYASLFDACGQSIVHFKFSLFEATDDGDPKIQHLTESITKEGFMLPIEASGGATLGTFVAEIPY